MNVNLAEYFTQANLPSTVRFYNAVLSVFYKIRNILLICRASLRFIKKNRTKKNCVEYYIIGAARAVVCVDESSPEAVYNTNVMVPMRTYYRYIILL